MNQKRQVLIIEDERVLSDLLKEGLEMAGLSVRQAFDGEEGLRIALEEKPYLIMLDLYMPVMDGIACLKALREDKDYGAKARVIVLSNLANREAVDKTVGLNVIDYIIKSNWGMKEIVDKIKFLVLD